MVANASSKHALVSVGIVNTEPLTIGTSQLIASTTSGELTPHCVETLYHTDGLLPGHPRRLARSLMSKSSKASQKLLNIFIEWIFARLAWVFRLLLEYHGLFTM